LIDDEHGTGFQLRIAIVLGGGNALGGGLKGEKAERNAG
jgi:hypothetical protein